MSFQDFMNKVRQFDNAVAKWLLRHFYFLFFQIALFIIFLFWFVNMFTVLDATSQIDRTNTLERLLAGQSINMTIIVFIMLLNSFWLLYIFNCMQRIRTVLKDVNYHIIRLRNRGKNN